MLWLTGVPHRQLWRIRVCLSSPTLTGDTEAELLIVFVLFWWVKLLICSSVDCISIVCMRGCYPLLVTSSNKVTSDLNQCRCFNMCKINVWHHDMTCVAIFSTKRLLSAAPSFTRHHSTYLIWQLFTLDILLDTTPKGFVSPQDWTRELPLAKQMCKPLHCGAIASIFYTKGPKVYQETITPSPACLSCWYNVGQIHAVMMLTPNSDPTI